MKQSRHQIENNKTNQKETKKKTTQQAQDHPLFPLIFAKHYQLSFRVITSVLISIVIFGGLGYLLDTTIETKPLFTIIGLIIALPIAIIIIIKLTRNLINKTLNGQHPGN